MKSKSFMLMIMSMGFGLVAAIGISQVMVRASKTPEKTVKTGPVLVSKEHLEHNTLLSEDNVVLEQWPVEIIPETAATSMEQVTDMGTKAALSKGMPIMLPHLVHKSEMGTLVIPDGMKVVAIKLGEADTIGGLLKPGDKVDILGYFRAADGNGYFSKTFLKAIRVFSVNSQMTAGMGSREETSTRGTAIVGVLVNERQAEAIMHVEKTGSLKLVLRGDNVVDGDDTPLEVLLPFQRPSDQTEHSTASGNRGNSLVESLGNRGSSASESLSMIVWNGNEPSKIVFEGNKLPDSSYRLPQRPADLPPPESKSEDLEDWEESAEFIDSDRGLDEDQYPGE